MLRNHDDTDEALQECLVRIYRHLPQLSELQKFPGWVMRIAVNQCNTHRSRSSAKSLLPLEEGIEIENDRLTANAAQPASPREAIERKETLDEINEAIAALPPRQRIAIVLFEVEGRSIKEIAGELECSEGAVKFNIHEARKKLRESLSQYLTPARAKARPEVQAEVK